MDFVPSRGPSRDSCCQVTAQSFATACPSPRVISGFFLFPNWISDYFFCGTGTFSLQLVCSFQDLLGLFLLSHDTHAFDFRLVGRACHSLPTSPTSKANQWAAALLYPLVWLCIVFLSLTVGWDLLLQTQDLCFLPDEPHSRQADGPAHLQV